MAANTTPPGWDRPRPTKTIPWRMFFRIIRWSTYIGGAVTLMLMLHKAPAPIVETSPQAAARAEQKLEQVERAVSNGQPATMRMDQTELNSYLVSHLDIAPSSNANPSPVSAAPVTQSATTNSAGVAAPASGSGLDLSTPAGT